MRSSRQQLENECSIIKPNIRCGLSGLHPLAARIAARTALGTLALLVHFVFPCESRTVLNRWSRERKRAGQHITVGPRPTKTPLREEARGGWKKSVGNETARERRNRGFDIVVVIIRSAVLGCSSRWRRSRERVRRTLCASTEKGARRGRGRRQYNSRMTPVSCLGGSCCLVC